MLSNYQKNPKSYKAKKLIADFRPRRKYLVHVENLQFYLKHGMKLDKIHTVISFTQKAFAKDFIEEVTKLRQQVDQLLLDKERSADAVRINKQTNI